MSTLVTTALRHNTSTSNNIILDSSGNVIVNGTLRSSGIATSIYPRVLVTPQATTSGTFVDFTGIPSWAGRIMVLINGVSTNGVSALLVQLGTSSGVVTSGYLSGASYAAFNVASTAGFVLTTSMVAAQTHSGIVTIATLGSNVWVESGTCGFSTQATVGSSGGNVTLLGTLDRVRLTTVNGTDIFDAGSVAISYEA